jgi:hypothetical protein
VISARVHMINNNVMSEITNFLSKLRPMIDDDADCAVFILALVNYLQQSTYKGTQTQNGSSKAYFGF